MGILKECYSFLRSNKRFALCTAITLVLAYGFYATHYTIHWDQLVSEYYDGLLLVSAGRWSATLIHLFTGWMDFAPFWHTAVMCLCLLFASVAWSVLFSEASGHKLTEPVLIAFGTVFVSFPVLQAQLTYPVLNIALSYALVPLAIRFIMRASSGKKRRIRRYLLALILLIFAVDMYESFAGVFLVGCFAVLILQYQFNDGCMKRPKYYVFSVLLASGMILAAIVIDMSASKLINLILSGTTEYWYGTNEYISWFTSDFFTCVKRLVCSLFCKYVIGSLSLPFLLFLQICLAGGAGYCIYASIKKRSALPVLLYAGLCLSAIALEIIVGHSCPFTQMQTLPVFAAFVAMLLFRLLFKDKRIVLKIAVSCLLIITVFSHTKTINNYAVENYERYSYETSILEDVGKDLLKHDTASKPVALYANNYELPKSLRRSRNSTHPTVRALQKVAFPFFDKVLPKGYFERMRRYYYPEIQNTSDLAGEIAKSFTAYRSYLCWVDFADSFPKTMARLGYTVIPCSGEQRAKIGDMTVENDPTCRYRITETDDLILVQIMTVD